MIGKLMNMVLGGNTKNQVSYKTADFFTWSKELRKAKFQNHLSKIRILSTVCPTHSERNY